MFLDAQNAYFCHWSFRILKRLIVIENNARVLAKILTDLNYICKRNRIFVLEIRIHPSFMRFTGARHII